MEHPATAISRDLAGQAERLCRQYLSNGRREGNYWLVGDLRNTPGRSLYVRLRASLDGGQAGKWTDAQSGEHGDLLDIIRASVPSGALAEALVEARHFLSLPSDPDERSERHTKAPTGSAEAARRLLAITSPIAGSPVEAYLASRQIPMSAATAILRFHPRCWYRRSRDDIGYVPQAMPAMIAPVTELSGSVTGAHRTWLMADGADKAAVASPRRAMGQLLGNGVRFGRADIVMASAEGIETGLSLASVAPQLSTISALSAAHLAAIRFPPILQRLYVARERDAAGRKAFARLIQRGAEAGVAIRPINSELGDLNADLRAFGIAGLAERVRRQLDPADRSRLM